MSLIGLDGRPISFDTPATVAAASGSQPAPFLITTSNSFNFEMTATQPAAAAAAASSSSSGLFSSQPVILSPQHQQESPFAPSLPQRSAQPVKIDFSEFEEDIRDMDAAARREFEEHLALNASRIASEKDGTAALPSQIGDSKLFHSLVLKQYGKVHQLENFTGKKAFQTRKANAREARRAKKAEDKQDQLEAKSGGAIRKAKHKNRSKGVY